MAMYDQNFFLHFISALIATVIGGNTTTVGNVINMNDQNDFEALTLALILGSYTDGNFQLILEDSEDGSTNWTLVAGDDLLGDDSILLTAAEAITQLGYAGKKQYVRPSIFSTSVTTGATATVVGVQGKPRELPISS